MKAASLRKFCLPALGILLSVVLSAPAFADDDDPPSVVARVSYLNGNVSFEPSGEEQFSQASLNYPITTGDRIYTDQGSRAELETGNIAVRISGNTDITTTSLTDRFMQFGLSQGTARFRAYNLPEDQSIEIDTPNAAFTILRPGNYRVETYPDSDTTFVTVTSGELEISGTDDSATVRAGQSVRLTGSNPPEIEYVSAPGSDDFDHWCGDRDRRFDHSRSSQYVSQDVPGSEDLDDYGQWEPAPQYGQVWYPSAVPVGWVPYRYGHWAWVDPWGWTWVEDEPWGFAPFHYGRWVFVGSRWGWIPAPPVTRRPCYAPALVAFVGGGGFSVSVRVGGGIQAWFPLGPDEPYYPPYHHSDVYLRQVNVTNVRNVTVINNYINVRNTNVTNITYVNQRVAVTAVSSEAFRSSQPVARQVVAIRADEAVRARVIEHPEVHPDARAVVGGAVQTHPQVQAARPMMIQRTVTRTDTHNGQGNPAANGRGTTPPTFTPPVQGTGQQQTTIDTSKAQHNNTGQLPPPKPLPPVQQGNGEPQTTFDKGQHNNAGQPPPKPLPPVQQGNGQPQTTFDKGQHNNTGQLPPPKPLPPVQQGNGQPQTTFDANKGQHNNNPVNPPTNMRPLVTKTPPPPPNPPFDVRKDAMQSHPGRPLEPQQVQNLRQGQPAGPMHDEEVHQHDTNKGKPPDQHGKDDHGKDDKKPH